MELRAVYQKTLKELMTKHKNVVMLDADLASASGSTATFKEFPNQTVNAGISEANMISAAAGMSLTGVRPYVHTFAPFATRRVLDQIFMSGAYSKNPIHIYGTDPGFWAQHNGGTHTSYEDIALLSAIPEVVVSAPSDRYQLEWILKEFMNRKQVFYTRTQRKQANEIYDETETFEFGKSKVIRNGEKIAVYAMGDMTHEALRAHDMLQEEGINITVVDTFFIKPFDTETLKEISDNHELIISIENHNKIGGLGSTIARELLENKLKTELEMIANQDVFGEVGEQPYLQAKHHLNAEHIVEKVKKHLNL